MKKKAMRRGRWKKEEKCGEKGIVEKRKKVRSKDTEKEKRANTYETRNQTCGKEKKKKRNFTVTGGLRGNIIRPKTDTKKRRKQTARKREGVNSFPCSKCFLLSPSAVCSGGNCPAEPNSFSI